MESGITHRQARIADVAARCRGGLVVIAMPPRRTAAETLARGSAFGAALQAAGVAAVCPLAIAARHRMSAIEAGVDVPCADVALAEGWARPMLFAASALVVLCDEGWEDSPLVIHDMVSSGLSSRPIFLVDWRAERDAEAAA